MTTALLPTCSIFPATINVPLYHPDWPDKPKTQHPSTGLKVLGKTPNTLPLVWAPWGVVAGPLVTPCSRRGGHKWAALLLCHLMLYNITYKVSCSPLPSYARCCTTSHKWAAILYVMLYIVQPHIALDGAGRAHVTCSPLLYMFNQIWHLSILYDQIFWQKIYHTKNAYCCAEEGISELSSTNRFDAVQHRAAIYHLLCTTSY